MKSVVLVIAPHPDDEVLGVGGTIARLAREGARVVVAIMTKGQSPPFPVELIRTGRKEARKVHKILGVQETVFMELPAAGVDTVPHRDVNSLMQSLVDRHRPDVVFIPFGGDLHLDHQLIARSALVAVRPNQTWYPKTVYAYETLSETNWNDPHASPAFRPNVWFNIRRERARKLKALAAYASQMRPFPAERSLRAAEALATLRGATVGVEAAEAFMLVRDVR